MAENKTYYLNQGCSLAWPTCLGPGKWTGENQSLLLLRNWVEENHPNELESWRAARLVGIAAQANPDRSAAHGDLQAAALQEAAADQSLRTAIRGSPFWSALLEEFNYDVETRCIWPSCLQPESESGWTLALDRLRKWVTNNHPAELAAWRAAQNRPYGKNGRERRAKSAAIKAAENALERVTKASQLWPALREEEKVVIKEMERRRWVNAQ